MCERMCTNCALARLAIRNKEGKFEVNGKVVNHDNKIEYDIAYERSCGPDDLVDTDHKCDVTNRGGKLKFKEEK